MPAKKSSRKVWPKQAVKDAAILRAAANRLYNAHMTEGETRRRYGACFALYVEGGDHLKYSFLDVFDCNGSCYLGRLDQRWLWPIPGEGRHRWKTHAEPRLIALCLFAAMLENP